MSNAIPISTLEQLVQVYWSKFTNVMNKSLKNKTVPDILKNALITPCHKKDGNRNKENYWPVIILSNFLKVIERLIHQKLSSNMEPKFSRFLKVFF